MSKNHIRILLIVPAILACMAVFLNTTFAQKGRDNFSHSTPAHKTNCNSCHKIPTANWTSRSQYPDVKDYPGHASCVQCHRNDFFRGNRPAICAVCHVNVGPRAAARFEFPLKSRSEEFKTIFPHDVHQNIIASNEKKYEVGIAHFVKANFSLIADNEIYGCAICHQTTDVLPKFQTLKPHKTAPLGNPPDKDVSLDEPFFKIMEEFKTLEKDKKLKMNYFKDNPDSHASCFNCHYQGQKPIRTDCKSCHQLTTPYFESGVVKRFSLKFNHLSDKQHVRQDCTACHVRITQRSDLRSLIDADVPLLTCSTSSCHGDELKDEIGKREKSITDNQKIFQCNYCHTYELGSYQIPVSHQQFK